MTPELASAIPELQNADAIADIGSAWTTAQEVREDLTGPERDLSSDTTLVVASDGRPAAFTMIFADSRPVEEVFAFAFVDPRYRGRGLGTFALGEAEILARAKIRSVPAAAESAGAISIPLIASPLETPLQGSPPDTTGGPKGPHLPPVSHHRSPAGPCRYPVTCCARLNGAMSHTA